MESRTAIVLFNLGGPDRAESVRPFLFNLFNDPAIIGLPGILRIPLAWLIAKRRAPKAREIYAHLGGGSPILPNTEAQRRALEAALAKDGAIKCFIAMRYWNPMSDETVQQVCDFKPTRVLLLPLYPQFSTTTTASSIQRWQEAARTAGLDAPTQSICCYPKQSGFVAAASALIREALAEAGKHGRPRLLLSAHVLPEKIIAAGDSYQWQCEETAKAIVQTLGIADLDWINCYQSRVGPLRWIGPATDSEIRRAGSDKCPLVVFPLAFVSEHSETLVELDIEYRKLAEESGVPYYGRAPAVGTHPLFIEGLANLVRRTLADTRKICSESGDRLCPHAFSGCPHEL